jgi:hypothetical protein
MSLPGRYALILSALALATLTAWATRPEESADAPPEQELTPNVAKEALLKMMRSEPGRKLVWFKGDIPQEMAALEIQNEEDGWSRWTGAFQFNVSKAIYTFTVQPRPGFRACTFDYGGSFVCEHGRWVASSPRLGMILTPPPE